MSILGNIISAIFGSASLHAGIAPGPAAADINSSFGARKQVAQELHYSGDTNDSSSMNVWLHKQVMQKLAL
jgi:uncharacterized protein DUF3597